MTTSIEQTVYTITRADLLRAGACAGGLAAFDTACPDGTLTLDITSPADAAMVLSGPLGGYEEWAQEKGLLPPFRLADGGDGATLTGTYYNGRRRRATAYVGEPAPGVPDGILPGVPYRVSYDGETQGPVWEAVQ